MDDEHDVEIFERIPWDSLEERPDRRWLVYLLAGVVVLAAVGISLGRQIGRPAQPPISTPGPTVTQRGMETAPSTTVPTSAPAPTWSEADLMALPVDSVGTGAAAVAEWFVLDFFTRDQPGGDRSFVEWARAFELEWLTQSTARVGVLVRRLATAGDDPYQRLEAEAWDVVTELGDEGWSVTDGPVQAEPPTLVVEGSDAGPHGSDRDPTVGAEWMDAAGVEWQIRRPVE